MKVLFTHSYFLQFDPKQVQHAQPYPPLGTILAAAVLREKGYTVDLFDTMFAKSPDEIIPSMGKFNPDVLVIYDDGFNYLTKMCLSNMREAAFRMQAIAKQNKCKVIVTGSDASDHYEKYLKQGADFVIHGEAELALLSIVDAIKNNQDPGALEGLIYFDAGTLKKNAKKILRKNLDEFPLPAWDLINIEPYKKTWLKHHGYFSLNVATTRGCPYKCNWCAKPIYGNQYNMRSAANVVKEIIFIKKLFQVEHIWFCDDIFGLKRSWVTEFKNELLLQKIKIRYKIQSRADLLVQEKYVEDLALSGCAEVWMGAESGSQKILDAMDKGTTVEEILKARLLLKQHQVKACFFLQYGYPGETAEDVASTIQMIEKSMPDDIGISVSYPLPGTVFYERVKSSLKDKTNWTDSDELALMFNNTYPKDYYKTLHRYTHAIFRKNKAKLLLKEKNILAVKLKAGFTYFKNKTNEIRLHLKLQQLSKPLV